MDILITFWGKKSKVKVTVGNDPKTGEYNIFVNIFVIFTKIMSRMGTQGASSLMTQTPRCRETWEMEKVSSLQSNALI